MEFKIRSCRVQIQAGGPKSKCFRLFPLLKGDTGDTGALTRGVISGG